MLNPEISEKWMCYQSMKDWYEDNPEQKTIKCDECGYEYDKLYPHNRKLVCHDCKQDLLLPRNVQVQSSYFPEQNFNYNEITKNIYKQLL